MGDLAAFMPAIDELLFLALLVSNSQPCLTLSLLLLLTSRYLNIKIASMNVTLVTITNTSNSFASSLEDVLTLKGGFKPAINRPFLSVALFEVKRW